MNHFIKLICFIIYLGAFKISSAQKFDSLSLKLIKGLYKDGQILNLGDRVPEIKSKMVNYSSDNIQLSDMRGKWIILDFWSNGCTSCIAAFPKMEKLQSYFGDKMMILPITFESANDATRILDMISAHKKLGKKIYSIVEDTSTYSLFSAYENPLEVWINPEGRLAAITGLEYVTIENIDAALIGKTIQFVDYSKKHFGTEKNWAAQDSSLCGSSFRKIYGYGDYSNSLILNPAIGTKEIKAIADWCSGLYITAYEEADSSSMDAMRKDDINKRIVANFNVMAGSDSTFLPGSYSSENQYKGDLYCRYSYELLMPNVARSKQIGGKMISDLDAFFGIESSIEIRPVTVLKLVKLNSFVENNPLNEQDEEFDVVTETDILTNGDMSLYLNRLNNIKSLPLIYDHTGIKDKIHLPLHLYKNISIAEIRMQLNKYGLDLIPEKRMMKMLVLKKINKQ